MINEFLSMTHSSNCSFLTSSPSQSESKLANGSTSSITTTTTTTSTSSEYSSMPILYDLLASPDQSQLGPYVLNFTDMPVMAPIDSQSVIFEEHGSPILKKLVNKRKKCKTIESLGLNWCQKEAIPSKLKREDFFLVEPEHTQIMELAGAENCLFLALARAFLYKFYFENKKYEFIIRLFCLNNLESTFKLDSGKQKLICVSLIHT